ncbi:MAG: pantetheine-phosphate adenylyltransferase [Bacteroidales bacterium]|nr:pantetheine-phosphate adenylyltransferase [Bacteroidales bacterium]
MSETNARIAIFPGSFDPFTIGHASIVRRGLPMFDRIIIGVGVNESKRTFYGSVERVEQIRQLYAGEPRVTVEAYTDLTIDFAQRMGASFILRGLRSVKDFEYERDIATMNHRLSGIETVLLFTEPEYSSISSSVVRELIHYNKDVSAFVPTKDNLK